MASSREPSHPLATPDKEFASAGPAPTRPGHRPPGLRRCRSPIAPAAGMGHVVRPLRHNWPASALVQRSLISHDHWTQQEHASIAA